MEEVRYRIVKTEADIAAANSVNDTERRGKLETYLLELQKEKILLLREAERSAAPAVPGNFPSSQRKISSFIKISNFQSICILFISFLYFSFDEVVVS